MVRPAVIIWLCLGALGLGILITLASRYKKNISAWWSFFALLLAPIFLCIVLPMWYGRWN